MYDVIVVGARCAGAPTAMLLARLGHRVLLLDRGRFPSDHPNSTHLVWQSGAARLRSWGLLDQVAASGCPPLSTATVDLGPIVLKGRPPAVDGVGDAYAPRRLVLDQILVDAAVSAGADLWQGSTFEDVRRDERGRVTGLVGHREDGSRFAAAATVVVGADGAHSRVARAVQAPERDQRPLCEGTWFAYWSGVPMDGMELYLRERRAVYGWPTNDGLVLVGVNWALPDFDAVHGDVEHHVTQEVERAAPDLARRLAAGQRVSRWTGGPPTPNLYRAAWGPGWALVGDAGYLKDPGTAQGISDAFRDADLLASALHDGLTGRRPMEVALAEYEHRRDAASRAMYEFTTQFTRLEPPPPEMLELFAAMAGNQRAIDQFLGIYAGSVAVDEFFAPDNVAGILAGAR